MCPYCNIGYSESEPCFCFPHVHETTTHAVPKVAVSEEFAAGDLLRLTIAAAQAEGPKKVLARKSRSKAILPPEAITAAVSSTAVPLP